MFMQRIERTTSVGIAGLAVAACHAFLSPPASAQSINVEQLVRVLNGQTILEAAAEQGEFTEEFFIDQCRFSPNGKNLFFSLQPGYQLYLAGKDGEKSIELYITVLDETFDVRIELDDQTHVVKTRVVEEREFVDGELFEISRNYFARCRQSNDIFYFGEDVCFFKGQECADTSGSWLAGVDDAIPGIIMPGRFLLGARYFQEQAPGVALDRATHVAMDVKIEVPAGKLEDCVVVFEDSALEPTAKSEKIYCPNVGLVKDGELELVSFGFPR